MSNAVSPAEERTSAGRLWFPLIIIAAALICHFSALGGWWLYDDPQLVLHALKVPAFDTLFNPGQYQTLATHTFTPLLPISFKVDLIAAGFSPRFFYAHQLAAIILAALLLYALLSRYVVRAFACGGAVLFVSIWPVVYAARTLMIRHYVEGLVAALAALVIFSRRRPDRSIEEDLAPLTEVAASFFYFLAMLGKEIYAPLPLLFILQSRSNGEPFARTVKRLIGPAVAAALFLTWRWFMLGSFGGYSNEVTAKSVGALPLTLTRHLTGEGVWWAAIPFLLLLAALTIDALIAKRLRAVSAALLLLLFALLPVIPLASMLEWRYAFALGVVAAAGVALAAASGRIPSRIKLGAIVIVAALLIAASFPLDRMYRRVNERMAAEGRYVWERPFSEGTLLAGSPAWYISGLRELRRMLRVEDGPRFVSSTLPIVMSDLDPARVVHYDAASKRFVSLAPSRISFLAEKHRRDFFSPMSIEVSKKDDTLRWKLKGTGVVRWSFVTLPEFATFEVPAEGERRVPEAGEERFFRIRGEMAGGAWTVSPEFLIPEEGQSVKWTRTDVRQGTIEQQPAVAASR